MNSLSIQVFHRCRVHQVDCENLICCSWCSTEIFPFLFFVCTAPGFSFGIGPASALGYPLVSVLHPDRRGLKEQLISGLWLTQAWGWDGYGMRGEPVAAEAGMTLQQPEACRVFSQGSCPWITGPWQWQAAQAPGRGGMDSDLCLHTGFLVAAPAALVFHACLWCLCL